MRTDTITIESAEAHLYRWGAGAAGGLVGGIGMGIILHAGANVMPFIGALYGWSTTAGGWAAHLVHSVLIGLVFALIVSQPVIREQMTTVSGSVVVGLVYAAAVGLVTSGVMLPIAMSAMGAQSLPESTLPLPGVIGGLLVILSVGVAHLVYGILLGATYGRIHTASPSTP